MKKLKCIVVDDEEGAHLVLSNYIGRTSSLQLTASFYEATQALEYIHDESVDVVFLDINMPDLTGLEMLEALSERPYIILTTAYSQYALEGYRYEVVDYLVKPFDFARFLSAVDKTLRRIGKKDSLPEQQLPQYLMLKVDGDLLKLDYAEIRYMQSYGNFVKFFTNETMLLSQLTTNELEEKIDHNKFMRVHKSYIVKLEEISRISGTRIFLRDNTLIPLGNTYRRQVLSHFTKKL